MPQHAARLLTPSAVLCCAVFQTLGAPTPDFAPAIHLARQATHTLIDRGGVPGVQIAVAYDGEVVWSEGFGFADIELGSPVTTQTRFGIGSITKSLTMSAAAAMAEEASLDLDAPIEQYVDEFPYPGRGVTIRQIATHTSGLSDDLASARRFTTEHYSTITDAYAVLRAERLLHEPGTVQAYATGTFTLIGLAMERAAETSFDTIIRNRVIEPAGMTATAPLNPAVITPHRTRFYEQDEAGAIVNAPTYDPSYKRPGAGYLSTAEDLVRFGSALLDGKLLKPQTVDKLWAPDADADADSGYALGFRVDHDDEARMVVHQPGGGVGISCWLVIYPNENLVFAVLTNMSRAPVMAAEFGTVQDAFLDASH
ncbi:MAG: serine hydrolase [Phycisphaeraceae bacterium]|nr:MAG: serine hydrolase [Phycisphaeraceae bacterium]